MSGMSRADEIMAKLGKAKVIPQIEIQIRFSVAEHLNLLLDSVVDRNYFLRFRFRLLKSYGSGSGSDFWKVMVPVPAPNLDHKKQIFIY